MIPLPREKTTQKQTIPVPKGSNFTGPLADQVAILAHTLLLMTATREEYWKLGYYIPCSKAMLRRLFGGNADKVKNLALNQYTHIFDWNTKYSDGRFPQSVRLRPAYRTGETELHTLSRKRRDRNPAAVVADDVPSRKLVKDFDKFSLPESTPLFENPWQALQWSRVQARDYYASRCEFGRFHSMYTAFKHRYAVQHKYPLSSIDIAGCQMLILGNLVLESVGLIPDVQEWLDICYHGDIYQVVADYDNRPRDEVKTALVTCIFRKWNTMITCREFQVLQRRFPTIAKYLDETKATTKYQIVAHRCQKRESEIVIDTVVPALAAVPMITVHDELIVPTRNVEQVQAVMGKAFAARGMRARFRIQEL